MASFRKRGAVALALDPLPFKKLRHITAEGGEEASKEPTRDEQLGALLGRLPFQADGATLPAALGGAAGGAAENAGRQQWMRELGEQLAAAQEELNIMLDVIHQVEAGTLVTVENVQRPKPTLAEHKDDVAKRVGMKQAATQSAHERLQAVAQRIKSTVDTDQAFYDDLRRLQADWKVKRLVSHGRVRFLVDLSLPPPMRGAPPVSSRLRSSLPEREQAAAQVELTRGKDGHVAAVPEAHRPQWEFVVQIHEQGGHIQRESEATGASEHDGPDVAMIDVKEGGEAFVGEKAETAVSNLGRGREAGPSQGANIEEVHVRLRRLQASLIAEGVFDSHLGEAVAHPPSGALVVRASTSELELSLAHGQRLRLYLRRTPRGGVEEHGRAGEGKAAEARAFLMEHFIEVRYGGQKRGRSGTEEEEKKQRRGGDHGGSGSAEAEGGLARLCRALQQEHAWSIIQRQVEKAVRAIPGAHTTACLPSLFRSPPAEWWLAVHVAGREVVTVLDDGTRCQIRGQGAPHHGDINAAYITAYVQDEIARYQIRQVCTAALERHLAAELRGLLTVVLVAALDDEHERTGWASLRRALVPENGSKIDADVEKAELWVTASPASSDGGIGWQVTYKAQRKGWRGKREGVKGHDVPLEVVKKMGGEGKLGEFLTWLTGVISTGQ
ncbi:hypothetical protein KFL_006040050 [Klebsormidium nitens]|uniref:Mediator complex subunit 17 n=1 Tax=Klebsormidium nitens TaxID=105231 RepID=A0A1Y1IHH7_KLENI|nr:hypothetical protein KFL_006040050 [Klebsormidium nitens]|eukprot:GAQ90133.1 hypothetical protein KFL_006040050 [Klebsormidium nitens]